MKLCKYVEHLNILNNIKFNNFNNKMARLRCLVFMNNNLNMRKKTEY